MGRQEGPGRPRKYSDEQVEEIRQAFEEYIDTTEIPIIAEFAYQNDVMRDDLYNYQEFSTLIKRAIDKKEANLEKLALQKKVDTGMAAFSLKQLGWTDRRKTEVTGEGGGPIETKHTEQQHIIQELTADPELGQRIEQHFKRGAIQGQGEE